MAGCLDGDRGLVVVRRADRALSSGIEADDADAGVAMTRPSVVAPLLMLVATIVTIVVAVRAVLHAPGIPYNVRELFLDQASVPALVFFALTLIWIGAGPMLLAHVLLRSRRPF